MDYAIQTLTEELLATVQSGIGEIDGVPTTGLYCLVLALMECEHVDVYGMGVGTIGRTDLSDLEYVCRGPSHSTAPSPPFRPKTLKHQALTCKRERMMEK